MTIAYIAIGSNLGARQAAIRSALGRLAELPGVTLLAIATFRETDPVDAPPGSGRFLNGAVALQTTLSPRDLLAYLLQIEREMGRDRANHPEIRNAPRVLDLDLLLYGNITVKDEDLMIPHPRMHERRFVLEPLAEIAPDAIHPITGLTVAQMLAALPVQ